MSDAKENEEAGQGVPSTVEENQQLVDAQVKVEPEAPSAPVPVEETSNHVENEKAEQPAEDGKAILEAVSEGIPQQDVQSVLPSDSVEADAGILNRTECEEASDVKMEAEEFPESNKGIENDDNVCQNSVGDAETAMEVKPGSNKGVENDVNVCQNSIDYAETAIEVKPESNKGVDNDDNVRQNSVDDAETAVEVKLNKGVENDDNVRHSSVDHAETVVEVNPEACGVADSKTCDDGDPIPSSHNEPTMLQPAPADTKAEIKDAVEVESKADEKQAAEHADNGNSNSKNMCFLDADHCYDGNESGTDEEQSAFMKELENFFRERSMDFKPPKFYGEGLNCLKLWRAVMRLGGYDKVTSCKLWRQVGESFKPPKTCTTVSWTFRGFYEKALLDYERHKIKGGELNVPIASHPEPMNIENQASASGRARRDAAARAMQGWHSQRLLGNGEVSDPIIKDRNSVSVQKREKQLKSINLLKRKKPSYMDNAVKAARSKPSKPQVDTAVVDIGPPADWVKVNVQKTKDCFEVYALVPGLLREEVRVQSDPAGRLVISGEPEHPNNPWGVTPFKKVVSLPSRIDPHQTSAVVTLHGQLFVRVPFEQSE